jgi:hypothetical protein
VAEDAIVTMAGEGTSERSLIEFKYFTVFRIIALGHVPKKVAIK